MVRGGDAYIEPRYSTDVITDNALQFIDSRRDAPGPFHLNVHYTAPHSPWDRDNHPKHLYDSYRGGCDFKSIPNVPVHPWQIDSAPVGDTEEKRRDILSGYFTAVTAMDANVGRILDRIEELGIRENTLVIFTSDNGMNMGHHGIYGKGNGTFPLNMYDTSVKVPAIVSYPGHVPETAICTEMLSHYDLRPTLLDYLGMEGPEADALPGRSFAPLLEGKLVEGRTNVVVYDEYGPVRMIRTPEWKYVHRYPYGPNELFDLAQDPGEEQNLADRPDLSSRIAELRGELEQWFLRYVDPAVDGTREGVTGKGQMGLAGAGANGELRFATNLHMRHGGEHLSFGLPPQGL
jgi:arylsulfatase A-like enzyme